MLIDGVHKIREHAYDKLSQTTSETFYEKWYKEDFKKFALEYWGL